MNNKMADSFIGMYPVSKTLRFELKPVGRTLEYIERDGIINEDTVRAQDYIKVKAVIDEYHKAFIQRILENLRLDGINEYYDLYKKLKRDDKEEIAFKELQTNMREAIMYAFIKDEGYKKIYKKELFTELLLQFLENDEEKKQLISSFSSFTTYFKGFNENRKNMYSDKEISTAIPYRIVHQNLPKYIDNISIFNRISGLQCKEEIEFLQDILCKKFDSFGRVEDYFTIEGFNKVLSQTGIDTYNTILGGFSTESGVKVQGINEIINLYCQKTNEHIPKMKPLFKQILSDRDSISFIPEQFESDMEVFGALEETYQIIEEEVLENKASITLPEVLSFDGKYNVEKIYINNDNSLSMISNDVFGDWSIIKRSISEAYDKDNPKNDRTSREKYEEKKQKELKTISVYSIKELNDFLKGYGYQKCVEDYFKSKVSELCRLIKDQYLTFSKIGQEQYSIKGRSLKKNDQDIAIIKNLCDSLKELQWLIKPFMDGQTLADKDESFYAELIRMWGCLDIITPLYNKVRNYLTSKPYSIEKIKLNFKNPTLLTGWDKNKERDYSGIILLKDDLYYLGIINRGNNKCIDMAPISKTSDTYQKMNYKLLPDPKKMIPKVVFSKKRIKEFDPDEDLKAKYDKGTHKKGPDFNINDCHALIDFFKKCIQKHEEWSQYGFVFSETDSYKEISDFYHEVSQQGYKLTYTDIDSTYIDQLVDEGSLYLFQIYNKDFSKYSKGKENLHTLYWKALFNDENLKDVIYALNGNAEIFYRRASIGTKDRIIHAANQNISNKDPLNDKKTSRFPYDIVKDRRYTCDKFLFHVPITMNYKADSKGEKDFNAKVRRQIHKAEDMHIIGIDRGEKNLLYISIIDMSGHIVKQMSLNQIISKDAKENEHKRDYHQMLVKREKENLESRRNWTTVGAIKELKEGYLSQIIHLLTELMVEYNAIIVLEDLNFGFKRGRQKFERQVYQKFEKMLIDKLNYLVDKGKDPCEGGGLLNAYQLTSKFESFQMLGKESGFLFYVPSWNTSKIDPTTGFVNLFYTKYESVDKTRDFIKKMDRIYYDDDTQCFAFDFDYSEFTYKAEGTRTKWTAYTYGNRIVHFRNPEKNEFYDTKTIDLTQEFKELFEQYNINYAHDEDIRDTLCMVNKADFYRDFMRLFAMMLQMRNSDEEAGIDEIVSPVKNKDGEFFVSGKDDWRPIDADANGAYNIAKKGLLLVQKIRESDIEDIEKLKLAISNKEWLKFAQSNTV